MPSGGKRAVSPSPPVSSSKPEAREEANDSDTAHPIGRSLASELAHLAYTSPPRRKLRSSTVVGRTELGAGPSSIKASTTRARKVVNPVATSTEVNAATSSSQKPKKRQKGAKPALLNPHPAPLEWEKTYGLIREMRKGIAANAPVDTMGCASPMSDDTYKDAKAQRLACLISLMLSSQTKDETVFTAVQNLRRDLGPGGITIENILAASDSVIHGAIGKVGFWNKKTEYIKDAMQKLKDEFDSDVPTTIEDLMSLRGVGEKMGFLVLQSAWNINLGIGVDVHVHRITNRLGWHKPPTEKPEQTRLNLESWLPNDLWGEINPLLVGFGQMICTPVKPRCDSCVLSSSGLCPSARKETNTVKKTKRKYEGAEDPADATDNVSTESTKELEGEGGSRPVRKQRMRRVEIEIETVETSDPL